MKTILALCLLGLIAGSFAKKHEPTKLHKAFVNFAKIADDDEVDQVTAILAEVEKEIQADFDELTDRFESAKASFEEHRAAYHDWKLEQEADLAGRQEHIESFEVLQQELIDAIDLSRATIIDSETQIDAIQAQRDIDHEAFVTRHDGLEKSIAAAEEALQLLFEIADQDLAPSLIQINHKKINNHFAHIAKKMAKVNSGTLSHSMAQILVQAVEGGINSEVAGQLVDLIEHLIKTLQEELESAVKSEDYQAAVTVDAIEQLNTVIERERFSAADNEYHLEDVNGELDAEHEWCETIQYWLDQYAAGWEQYDADCQTSFRSYEALLRRLARDLEALDAAQEIVGEW